MRLENKKEARPASYSVDFVPVKRMDLVIPFTS